MFQATPRSILLAGPLFAFASFAHADWGEVLTAAEISATSGGLSGGLVAADAFGGSCVAIGDLDGDGTGDLAVGVPGDDDGGTDRGAVLILFLNTDGSVASQQKISDLAGSFPGALDDGDAFGAAVCLIGDINGDTIPDIAVGAPGDDDSGTDRGAVWLLALDTDGTVVIAKKASGTQAGGMPGAFDDADAFGSALTGLGDIDGDGARDIAAGAPGDDDGGSDRGAAYVLFLNPAPGPALLGFQKISSTQGSFTGSLDDGDGFGSSLSSSTLTPELAVGTPGDDDGGSDRGAVWLLLLNSSGEVTFRKKVSDVEGNFGGTLDDGDGFGSAVARLGDVDGDGIADLAVGAANDDDGDTDAGAVWILSLTDGVGPAVQAHVKIADGVGGFPSGLAASDGFGSSLAFLGDLDGDGRLDLAAGAPGDDDGAADAGALHVLFLDTVLPAEVVKYGTGVNPLDSLVHLAGVPSIGTMMTFGLDNPLGTQGAGSGTALILAVAPDPNFPAGTSIPGFGMGGPGAPGELLVSLTQKTFFLLGAPWTTAGVPVPISFTLPPDPSLFGLFLYAQGLIVDPLATFGVVYGFAEAYSLRIGP